MPYKCGGSKILIFWDEFRHLQKVATTTWMTRRCMTIQMVVVTKVMVDRSLELHGVTDKRAATTTTTILN